MSNPEVAVSDAFDAVRDAHLRGDKAAYVEAREALLALFAEVES